MAKEKKPHQWKGKLLNWNYCVHCGLLALKNDATRKAIRAACRNGEDN